MLNRAKPITARLPKGRGVLRLKFSAKTLPLPSELDVKRHL